MPHSLPRARRHPHHPRQDLQCSRTRLDHLFGGLDFGTKMLQRARRKAEAWPDRGEARGRMTSSMQMLLFLRQRMTSQGRWYRVEYQWGAQMRCLCMSSWPWTGLIGRAARYPVSDVRGRCLWWSTQSPVMTALEHRMLDHNDSLPPVCLPHFLISSGQLKAVPFGALPAVPSAQFPLSKAWLSCAL